MPWAKHMHWQWPQPREVKLQPKSACCRSHSLGCLDGQVEQTRVPAGGGAMYIHSIPAVAMGVCAAQHGSIYSVVSHFPWRKGTKVPCPRPPQISMVETQIRARVSASHHPAEGFLSPSIAIPGTHHASQVRDYRELYSCSPATTSHAGDEGSPSAPPGFDAAGHHARVACEEQRKQRTAR